MLDAQIILPSKPKIISEKENTGTYQVDGLYPGYGHTLGNSLRRIILSSLPGAAITKVKIDGVAHEFETIEGVKEDVIAILLNLKRIRFKLLTSEPQVVTLSAKGEGEVLASSLDLPGQVELLNPDQKIATLTNKNASLNMELHVQGGLGYVSKENLHQEKVDIGTIAVDAIFTPIRRVNYEVENMRVGDRTDYNRLTITIETDGTLTPREALEKSIEIMITQLKAIIGFQEEEHELDKLKRLGAEMAAELNSEEEGADNAEEERGDTAEVLKTRTELLNFSKRTASALAAANIRTVGGLVRKRESDLLALSGLGEKGLEEIKAKLDEYGLKLKD